MKFVTTWMDLEIIMISEMSLKKTNTVWSHLCVESKKQENKKQKSNSYIEKRLVVARGEGVGWVKRVNGPKRYKLIK